MSQFVFNMSSRMVAIAVTCMVLLCILLFLLGVQIGKLLGEPLAGTPAVASSATAIPSAPGVAPSSSSAAAPPSSSP